MVNLDLNGAWELRHGPQRQAATAMSRPEIPAEWETLPAQVPGNVELDLVRAGRLPPDLDAGEHIYLLRPLETHQWWYARTFDLAAGAGSGRHELVFDGVDTLASVWLNGERVATLENMLIPHRVDVSAQLRPGRNLLQIGIDSPILAAQRIPIDSGQWAQEGNWEGLSIRKAPHGYGWDIMPRVVSAGLWRSVRLETIPALRFHNVYLATEAVHPARRRADLAASWDLDAPAWPLDGWTVRLTLAGGKSGSPGFESVTPVLCAHAEVRCHVDEVDLWWPRGYGDPALYEVRLELRDEHGQTRAEWSGRHGFRTAVLERREGAGSEPGTFGFAVNGVPVFIRGTNWVPLDAFHSRDEARLPETFDLLLGLNCNLIRCWGGNVYESDALFDRCDEAGVMVWQDFALGCAIYPQTDAFHRKMRLEAEGIVPRLRNHPSLVLWAGNNEVDTFYLHNRPRCDPNVDDRISREVLPAACHRLDPWRDYLPSSPYLSPRVWSLGGGSELRAEDHLWGPRNDFKGEFYVRSRARFASETGYHGCPGRSSLKRMITPGRLWPWQDNDDWVTHGIRPLRAGTIHNYRVGLMAHQIGVLFGRVPDDLDEFIAGSQISQAEALKFFIERFRLAKGERTGIIWWNLRDGWPEISDAVVDYYGSRKRAYGVIRRVQTDVCVMVGEPEDGRHEVVAVNDTLRPAKIELVIADAGNTLLRSHAAIAANGRTVVGHVPASATPAWYALEWQGPGIPSARNHYLAGPRPFSLTACRQWYDTAGL